MRPKSTVHAQIVLGRLQKLLQFIAIQDLVASSMSNKADLDPRPRFQANLVLRLVSGSPKSCATGTVVPNVTRSPQ
jgi:hypothetical protein